MFEVPVYVAGDVPRAAPALGTGRAGGLQHRTWPLNVLLLGAAAAVTRLGGGVHPVLALGAVSVGLAMVMAQLQDIRSARPPARVGGWA